MPACFVEQHSTRTTLNDNGHRAAWCRAGLQLGDSLASCTLRQLFNALFVKQFKPNGVAKRIETGLHLTIVRCHNIDSKVRAHLFVGCEHAVAVHHKNATLTVSVTCRYLHNAVVNSTCNIVCNGEKFYLARFRDRRRCNANGVHLLACEWLQRNGVCSTIATRCSSSGCFGCSHETRFGEIGGVGKARCFAIDDTNTCTRTTRIGNGFYFAVI